MNKPSLPENQLASSQVKAATERFQLSTVNSQPPAIPDHELLRKIGGGSYGEVWLARNVLDAWRAVKIVYRTSFDHDRPFEREFAGIQKFEPISRTHESQVDILHVGRGDGYFYYVMELADDANVPHPGPLPQGEGEPSSARRQAEALQNFERHPSTVPSPGGEGQGEGERFSSVILDSQLYTPRTFKLELQRRGRLPFDDCVQIGLALTTALEHLHKHGLVHRDIKPSNIIFVNGQAKLADIGLVTSVDATRSFVGTEGYLAPEGPGTPQADIYSLGKVLYEMSTGQDRRHFPALPPDVAQLPDQQQVAELNAVVVKACQLDPKLRYQSAEAMQADMAQLEAGRSVRRKRSSERRWAMVKKFGLVAAALALLIASPSLVRIHEHGQTANPEAVRLYELGRWHLNQVTEDGLNKAVEYLNQAIQIDPQYVPAYVILFEVYCWNVGGMTDAEKSQKLHQIADKLLHINPKLAEGHAALATAKFVDLDWRKGEEQMKLALKLNPDYGTAHGLYGFNLCIMGRIAEAHEELKRSQELLPTSRIAATVAGFPFMVARDFTGAVTQFKKTLALDPNFGFAHNWIGRALEGQGNYPGAMDEYEKSDLLNGADEIKTRRQYQELRQAYAQAGAEGYWRKVKELVEPGYTPARGQTVTDEDRWPLAGVYARLGLTNEAIALLEKEAAAGRREVLAFKTDPSFDKLNDQPRFRALLRRVGLEESAR